ncbi:MAG: type II secretion system protein GspD, partial [Terriglobia bacterium]
GAFWVRQPDGTVLVASDTPENRSRYQPLLLKTFVLPGRTPEELNDAVRLLREVLDMRRIVPDARSNTFTVRDTPLRLAVAEQLLEQVQGEPGEIWLDVLLLEVDRERAQQFGLLPPDQAVVVHLGAGALAAREGESLQEILQFLLDRGLLPQAITSGITFDPVAMSLTIPRFILFGGGETTFAANLPGATLSLSHLSRVTRSVRHFSFRAREGEEATFFSGERFPVVFTTFSSIFIPEIVQELIARGEFIPPVPAFQYEELGVRMTVRPRLHSGREISLGLKLDQKALTGEELNEIPILSNRVLEQQVRLRQGQTLMIGGLRSDSREETRTGTPLLGSAPVIGHLFRRTAPRKQATELIVLLTPHIVRLPVPERVALRPLYVGTESEFAPAGTGPALARPRRPQPPAPRPPTPPQPPRPQLPQPQTPPPQPPRPQN